MKVLVVIPARYNSTRFPGKPIRAIINGKTMIENTYIQVQKSSIEDEHILVATDDKRIFEEVNRFGGNVIMTEKYHKTGTERLLEIAESREISIKGYDGFINVQGDEPFIDPVQINTIIDMMELNSYSVATLHAKCESLEDLYDDSIIKQVITHEAVNDYGKVLYSSRQPIPWPGKNNENFDKYNYYIHIGIYGFPIDVINRLDLDWQPPLQLSENLEQLNWASMGIDMHSRLSTWNIGINTHEDLKKVDGTIADEIPWIGCMSPNSYNYDPDATVDDDTCEPFPQVPKRWKDFFEPLDKKTRRKIYDEYKYYLTSATSKYYPMNNPNKIANFWKTRNFSMDVSEYPEGEQHDDNLNEQK